MGGPSESKETERASKRVQFETGSRSQMNSSTIDTTSEQTTSMNGSTVCKYATVDAFKSHINFIISMSKSGVKGIHLKQVSGELIQCIETRLNCEVIRTLSKGGQAIVLDCRCKTTQTFFVVKVGEKADAHSFQNEMQFFNALTSNKDSSHSFFIANAYCIDTVSKYNFLQMQRYPLSFDKYITNACIPMDVLKLQLHMIARGVQACHFMGIIHFDIKPANIMLGNDLVPRLIDFGMATAYHQFKKENGIGGTKNYRAPETYKPWASDPSTKHLMAFDLWSLGVTFYVAVFQQYPFKVDTDWSKVDTLPEIKFKQNPQSKYMREISEKDLNFFKDLISKLLTLNPTKRLSAAEVTRHEWFDWRYPLLERPNVLSLMRKKEQTKA